MALPTGCDSFATRRFPSAAVDTRAAASVKRFSHRSAPPTLAPFIQSTRGTWPDDGAATGRQARCQRQAMSEDDLHDGSAAYRVLRAQLDSLEIEFEALEALRPRTYGESRSRGEQLRVLGDEIGQVRARILALGPWESPSPNWGDGSYGCAGCATTEGLCRPGFLRWAQPAGLEPPAGVVVQSGHGDAWCGAFVFCESCLPACCRCQRPRPRPGLRDALAAGAAMGPDCAIVWRVEPCADDHLDDYAATIISDRDGALYTGPGAGALPVPTPAFVITAWNPGSEDTHPQHNAAANDALAALLVDIGISVIPVVGTARDGSWREDSFLVSAITRADAVAIGARFGQLAVFELTDDTYAVVEVASGRAVRVGPRRGEEA